MEFKSLELSNKKPCLTQQVDATVEASSENCPERGDLRCPMKEKNACAHGVYAVRLGSPT